VRGGRGEKRGWRKQGGGKRKGAYRPNTRASGGGFFRRCSSRARVPPKPPPARPAVAAAAVACSPDDGNTRSPDDVAACFPDDDAVCFSTATALAEPQPNAAMVAADWHARHRLWRVVVALLAVGATDRGPGRQCCSHGARRVAPPAWLAHGVAWIGSDRIAWIRQDRLAATGRQSRAAALTTRLWRPSVVGWGAGDHVTRWMGATAKPRSHDAWGRPLWGRN